MEIGSASLALAATVIGFVGGICGGVWGIGAGWVAVPSLLLLGVPPQIAIAASTVHLAAKSILPTATRWRRLPQADRRQAARLAWPMGLGSVAAVIIGVELLSYAAARSAAPLAVDLSYVFLLVSIIAWGLYVRLRPPASGALTGRSAVVVSGVGGLATGFLAGFLGIGGGLVRRPLLTYVIRTPESVTGFIGQVTVLVTSVIGALLHRLSGNIDWRIVLPLAAGGIVGQWLGTVIAARLEQAGLRGVPQKSFLLAAGGLLAATLIKLTGWLWGSQAVVLAVGCGITALIAVQLARAMSRTVDRPSSDDL